MRRISPHLASIHQCWTAEISAAVEYRLADSAKTFAPLLASFSSEADGSSEEIKPSPTADSDAGRRQSGSQASSSRPSPRQPDSRRPGITSIAHLKPATAKVLGINPDGTITPSSSNRTAGQNAAGGQQSSLAQRQTTLEAKKAYRQELTRKARQRQQIMRDAPEEAPAGPATELSEREEPRRKARVVDPRGGLMAGKSLRDRLTAEDCAKYVQIDPGLLPEVFPAETPKQEKLHPRGGCQGLKDELEATYSDCIMHRECTQKLLDTVRKKRRRHLYLTGPPSSGRSVTLAAAVSALRAEGWLVMYIPQAKQLTHGGFFLVNDSGGWDTPECAKLIMHYLLASNPDRVASIQSPKTGRSLKDIIEAASNETEAAAVVDACLEVKEAVASAENAAIAIDNYQALYAPSGYGEWLSTFNRRLIDPSRLRLAAAMRVLEQPPLRDGVVICAAEKAGSTYSAKLKVPVPRGAEFEVPRMSKAEWQAMAKYYSLQSVSDNLTPVKIERAFFTTGGNPKEFRKLADLFTLFGLPEPVAA